MLRDITLIEGGIVLTIIAILGALVFSAYSDSQRPTIEIKKDDWECVKSEQRSHLHPMQVGQTMILMPMTSTVCVEYKRRTK